MIIAAGILIALSIAGILIALLGQSISQDPDKNVIAGIVQILTYSLVALSLYGIIFGTVLAFSDFSDGDVAPEVTDE